MKFHKVPVLDDTACVQEMTAERANMCAYEQTGFLYYQLISVVTFLETQYYSLNK